MIDLLNTSTLLNMEIYESQEQEICQMARKHRILESDLAAYVTKTNREIRVMFPDQTNEWKLFRAERETWNHFFPSEKFPGSMPIELSSKELSRSRFHDRPQQKDETRRHSRIEATRNDKPWVHDLYNPSPSLPPSRPRDSREIDSYKPAFASRTRQYEIDSYRPSPVASVSYTIARKGPASLTLPGSSFYKSQNNLMREKAKSMGVSVDEYSMAHGRFTKQVHQQLSNPNLNPSWVEWKKESIIWYHFFGQEKFPGQEPAMKMAGRVPMAHIAVPAAGLPPTESYASCWRSIEHRAALTGIPLSQVNTYHKDRVKYANAHFYRQSSAWIRWFAEFSTWSHFFPNLQFVGLAPQRDETGSPILPTSPSTPISPDDITQRSLSSVTRHPNSLPTNTSEGGPSLTYDHLEKVMEEKAKRKGVRREFFQYLQKSRDIARLEHSDCTKDVRHYLADHRTWMMFFSPEPFPGIKPFGGHTPVCIKKALQASKVSHPSPTSNLLAPTSNFSGRSKEVPTSSVSTGQARPADFTLQHKVIATTLTRSQLSSSQSSVAFINITYENGGPKLTLGRATKSAITTLTVEKAVATQLRLAFERDDTKKIEDLEERLKCRLEGVQSLGGSLTITIKPFHFSDVASFELTFRLVVGWVETCVTGNIQDLSSYANAFTPMIGVRDPNVLIANALSSPIILLVNGKYVALDPTKFSRIRRTFSKDLQLRELLENRANCRFVLVELGGENDIKHLIAATNLGPRGMELPPAKHLSPSRLLWHPHENSLMNIFLEKWAVKVAGSSQDHQAPSIPAFWEEYRSENLEMGETGSASLVRISEAASLPAGGTVMDLDDMIMEEAAKVNGFSSTPIDLNLGETLSGVKGYVSRIVDGEQGSSVNSGNPEGIALDLADFSGWGRDLNETGVVREKRKLQDSVENDQSDEEEGEVVEERAEKRAKI